MRPAEVLKQLKELKEKELKQLQEKQVKELKEKKLKEQIRIRKNSNLLFD